jgi:hypothetical protein
MPTTIDIESQRMLLGSTPVRKLYRGANLIGARIAELFANGEQGVWFDPSDFSTLFQDSAGTIPVTGVEQPVGLMLDKSGRGNHASQATTTARPILRQDGNGKHYLSFDGVDDHLNIVVLNMSAASAAGYFSAITKLSDASSASWYSHGRTTAIGSVRLLAPANNGQASVRAGFYSTSGLKELGGTAHAAPITLTVRSEIGPGGAGMWITHNNGAKISTTVDPTVFSADGVACMGAQVFASTRGNFFNGRIYAFLVAGRKSSGSEQAAIEAFLRNKSRAY